MHPKVDTTLGEGREKSRVYFQYSQPTEQYYHPPKDGSRQFTVIWWMEGFHLGPCWRAQVYYANPEPHRRYWADRGYPVVEE